MTSSLLILALLSWHSECATFLSGTLFPQISGDFDGANTWTTTSLDMYSESIGWQDKPSTTAFHALVCSNTITCETDFNGVQGLFSYRLKIELNHKDFAVSVEGGNAYIYGYQRSQVPATAKFLGTTESEYTNTFNADDYTVWIFFAHRSSSTPPKLSVQSLSQQPSCNAMSAGYVDFKLSEDHSKCTGWTDAEISSSGIALVSSNILYSFCSVWQPSRDISSGFFTKFRVNFGTNSQGFAFVFHNSDDGTSLQGGGAAAKLGYSFSTGKVVSLAFYRYKDNTESGSIELRTGYTNPTLSSQQPKRVVTADLSGDMSFAVHLNWSNKVLTVYQYESNNEQRRKLMQHILDDSSMKAVFGATNPRAVLGFTSSTGTTNKLDGVNITDWTVSTVPVSAGSTIRWEPDKWQREATGQLNLDQLTTTITASNAPPTFANFDVIPMDACQQPRNDVSIDDLEVQYTSQGQTGKATAQLVSGVYRVFLNDPKSTNYTNTPSNKLTISLGNSRHKQALVGSPLVHVIPGEISARASTVVGCDQPCEANLTEFSLPDTVQAGKAVWLKIFAKDANGNLPWQTQSARSNFQGSFDSETTTFNIATGPTNITAEDNPSVYTMLVSTTIIGAKTRILYVWLNQEVVLSHSVRLIPGILSGSKSEVRCGYDTATQLCDFGNLIAGQNFSIYVKPVDDYSNTIPKDGLTVGQLNMKLKVQNVADPEPMWSDTDNQWVARDYQITKTGQYRHLSVVYKDDVFINHQAFLRIHPADPVKVVFEATTFISTLQAGTAGSFEISLKDRYENSVLSEADSAKFNISVYVNAPGSTSSRVICESSTNQPTIPGISGCNCVYFSSGKYKVRWSNIYKLGNYEFQLDFSGSSLQTKTATVTSGFVDVSNSMVIQPTPAQVQAGEIAWFTLRLKDSFSNLIKGKEINDIVIRDAGTTNTIEFPTIEPSTSGDYQVKFNGTKVGNFSIGLLSVDGEIFSQKYFGVEIIPSTPTKFFFGERGWGGNQQQKSAPIFTISLADSYDNLIPRLDSWQLELKNDQVNFDGTSVSPTNSFTISPTDQQYGYSVQYNVSDNQGEFQNLGVQVTAGSYTIESSTKVTVIANLETYAYLSGLPASVAADGDPFTFTILDKDQLGQDKKYESYQNQGANANFKVEFTITDAGRKRKFVTSSVANPESFNSNEWVATMRPPTLAGRYSVKVILNSQESGYTGPSPVFIVTPGIPSEIFSTIVTNPSFSAVVGTSVTLVVTLFDKYQNKYPETRSDRKLTVTVANNPTRVTAQADGTFVGTFTETVAGAKQILAIDTATTQQFLASIQINPGEPTDNSEILYGPSTPPRAGIRFGFILNVKDKFGNRIDTDKYASFFTARAYYNDTHFTSDTAVSALWDETEVSYRLSLIVNKINSLQRTLLKIFYKSKPIANISTKFLPSAVGKIVFTNLKSEYNVKDKIQFSILMTDVFANTITTDLYKTIGFSISMSPKTEFVFRSVATSRLVNELIYPNSQAPISKAGNFTVSLEIGTYNLNNLNVVGLPARIAISPAGTYPANTHISFPNSLTAGESLSFSLSFKDEYKNPSSVYQNPEEQDNLEVKLIYFDREQYNNNPTLLCDPTDRKRFRTFLLTASPVTVTQLASSHEIATNLTIAGTYYLSVETNGASILKSSAVDCTAARFVQIVPDEPDIENSGFEGQGLNAGVVCNYGKDEGCLELATFAGVESYIKVFLQDKYGNRVETNRDTTVKFAPTDQTWETETEEQLHCALVSDFPGFTKEEIGGEISIKQAQAGYVTLTFTLTGLLPGENNAIYISNSDQCSESEQTSNLYPNSTAWSNVRYSANEFGITTGEEVTVAVTDYSALAMKTVVIVQGTAGKQVGCGTIIMAGNDYTVSIKPMDGFLIKSVLGDISARKTSQSKLQLVYSLRGLLPNEDNCIKVHRGNSCSNEAAAGKAYDQCYSYRANSAGVAQGMVETSLDFSLIQSSKGLTVVIYQGTGPARVSCGVINADVLETFEPENKKESVEGGLSRFDYKHEKANLYRIGVTVAYDGSSAKEVRAARPVTNCKPRLRVYPSEVASFTTRIKGDIAAVAGVPQNIMLQAQDKYKNVVQNTRQAFHYYDFNSTLANSTVANISSYWVSLGKKQITPELNFHDAYYLYEWPGDYSILISLKQGNYQISRILKQSVEPAYCENGYFRCKDGSTCQRDRSLCGDQTEMVACEVGMSRCSQGYCAKNCPLKVNCTNTFLSSRKDLQACDGSNVCTDADSALCPKQVICPTGYIKCPNGICARESNQQCGTVLECDKTTCPNGKCAERLEDCDTTTSCSDGQVRCHDNSCRSSATLCPDAFRCYDPFPYLCSDGSCREDVHGCPSSTTCPIGLIKCEHGGCRTICTKSGVTCPLPKAKCPDGSCRQNLAQCGSKKTCPTAAPVMCPDGSCVSTVTVCANVWECPDKYFTCPDGSCVTLIKFCPTLSSCPFLFPIKCSDGSCVDELDKCPELPPMCPLFTCPGGACVDHVSKCPTQIQCPRSRPVRCEDGSCVEGLGKCKEAGKCNEGQKRCPSGECVKHLRVCGTETTCPKKYSRCSDGACRPDCDIAFSRLTCPASRPYPCPAATSGFVCVTNSTFCAGNVQCPPHKSVRCLDATCAYSVKDCPRNVEASVPNLIACPDGSWQQQECGGLGHCPQEIPVKCWDRSCRVTAEDCPPIPSCHSFKPFLCPNGCKSSLADCYAGNTVCQGQTPVKCAYRNSIAGSFCTDVPQNCPTLTTIALLDNSCPEYGRCFDGSCQKTCRNMTNFGSCKPTENGLECFTCPPSFPYLCDNGVCSNKETDCRKQVFSKTTGCPVDKPFISGSNETEICIDTKKTDSEDDISKWLNCPNADLYGCLDGSCRDTCECDPRKGQDCQSVLANGCKQGEKMCNSKVCAESCNGPRDDGANVCPHYATYRCADGLCASSSRSCPVFAKFVENKADPTFCGAGMIRCGSGDCRASWEMCPHITPCPVNKIRCQGSGACVDKLLKGASANELNQLTQDMVCNKSRVHKERLCPQYRPHRCDNNGLCVESLDFCADVNMGSTGCSEQLSHKCADGHCVKTDASECPAAILTRTDSCAFVCPDGRCKQSEEECSVCSDNSTQRCSDGSCKKFSAIVAQYSPELASLSCRAHTRCSLRKPFLCADGSCQPQNSLCRPVFCKSSHKYCANSQSCVPSLTLCSDTVFKSTALKCEKVVGTPKTDYTQEQCELDCVQSTACIAYMFTSDSKECLLVTNTYDEGFISGGSLMFKVSSCPIARPFMCDDGACVESSTECAISQKACQPHDFQCSDGSCVVSPKECIISKFQSVFGTWQSANQTNIPDICGKDQSICWNGACYPKKYASSVFCPPVPACSASHPNRIYDGSCVSDTQAARVEQSRADWKQDVCEFGLKIDPCPTYHGCRIGEKLCPGVIQCVGNFTKCDEKKEETCKEDCERHYPAMLQNVFVSAGQSVDVAVSMDDEHGVRSIVTVPSNAFGKGTLMRIEPVSFPELSGSGEAKDKIISTPFRCHANDPPNIIQLTLNAPVDIKSFSRKAAQKVTNDTIPCQIQSQITDFDLPVQFVNTSQSAGFTLRKIGGLSCTGFAAITKSTVQLYVFPEGSCQEQRIDFGEQDEALPNNVSVIQPYDPIGRESWTELTMKKNATDTICLLVYTISEQVYIFADLENSSCITSYRSNALTLEQMLAFAQNSQDSQNKIQTFILIKSINANDECIVQNAASNIQNRDVCLARVGVDSSSTCLATYDQRKDEAHVKYSSGNHRFYGNFPCDGEIYAFVNKELPPPPVEAVEELGVCDNMDGYNPCVVGGVVGGVLVLLFALGMYALWRLNRYRTKYKAEKEHLDELADRAADLDEFAGGLGIADDEVDMIANPLVIEMQNLQDQIQKVQDNLGVQVERDVSERDQLEMERQRLHAEIERVKKVMAGMTVSRAPQRAVEMTEMNSMTQFDHGTRLLKKQSDGATFRHQFGQVARAKKKTF